MKLGVNIDHVATLRQARGNVRYPDPITAAAIVENAGADQITIHLREDRRHIQEHDLRTLRKTVAVPLNLELAASREIVDIAAEVKPDICTFVPERRQELTTEGGLDVVKSFDKLSGYVKFLKEHSIVVSMFIDPDLDQVDASKEVGADAIELHTGRYCELFKDEKCGNELTRLKKSAIRADEIGLHVAAGHGLNYDNTSLIVKEIPQIVEYNIGHAIIARAVFVGLSQAVKEIKKIVGGLS
jgi:pyridoxine 5-phosphate synthase